MRQHDSDMTVRLDKWLWAARFFKTRALANEAVTGGLVHLHGERTKPAKGLRVGDELTIRRGPYRMTVVVRDLSDRRGPANMAVQLYDETEASRRERELTAATLKVELAVSRRSDGRPTKKDRRALRALRRG